MPTMTAVCCRLSLITRMVASADTVTSGVLQMIQSAVELEHKQPDRAVGVAVVVEKPSTDLREAPHLAHEWQSSALVALSTACTVATDKEGLSMQPIELRGVALHKWICIEFDGKAPPVEISSNG